MTDTFNPDQFLGTTTDSSNVTSFEPVPEGEWPGQIKDIKVRRFQGKKDPTALYTALDIRWIVLDAGVAKKLEMEEPLVRQSLFLDLTPSGGLDFGKNRNVGLGRLREALGQNRAGKSWSLNHLVAGTATILVKHVVNEETGDPQAEVTKVAKKDSSRKAA